MPGPWRYVYCDLLTDAVIDTLDTDVQSFSHLLNGTPGVFTGTIAATNRALAARAAKVIEGRSVVYAYRGDRFYGGPYNLWIVPPTSDDKGQVTIPLQGATLESYLSRREIRADLTYTATDQLEIARALLTHMQAVRTEGDVGITFDSETSGVLRDRTYLGSDLATYGQRLTELGNVDDGFEWRISCSDPGDGTHIRKLTTGYPTLGGDSPEHLFEQPGNVITWTRTGDATLGATSFVARGDTDPDTGIPLICDPVVREDLLAAGWPLIDTSTDYQSVIDPTTLTGHATANAAAYGGSLRVLTMTVSLPDDDSFTPDNLGDFVRAKLVNDYYPLDGSQAPTFSVLARVIGIEIQPAKRGQGVDQAVLTLSGQAIGSAEADPARAVYPGSFGRVINDLQSQVGALWSAIRR